MWKINIQPDETYDKTVSVRITNNQYKKICELAYKNNTNIAVIIRSGIQIILSQLEYPK